MYRPLAYDTGRGVSSYFTKSVRGKLARRRHPPSGQALPGARSRRGQETIGPSMDPSAGLSRESDWTSGDTQIALVVTPVTGAASMLAVQYRHAIKYSIASGSVFVLLDTDPETARSDPSSVFAEGQPRRAKA